MPAGDKAHHGGLPTVGSSPSIPPARMGYLISMSSIQMGGGRGVLRRDRPATMCRVGRAMGDGYTFTPTEQAGMKHGAYLSPQRRRSRSAETAETSLSNPRMARACFIRKVEIRPYLPGH